MSRNSKSGYEVRMELLNTAERILTNNATGPVKTEDVIKEAGKLAVFVNEKQPRDKTNSFSRRGHGKSVTIQLDGNDQDLNGKDLLLEDEEKSGCGC